MSASGRSTSKGQPDVSRRLSCLVIEVIDDLHVISDETDRRNHDGLDPLLRKGAQVVIDVRLQPGVSRAPRPRAICQIPLRHVAEGMTHLISNLLAHRLVLGDVISPWPPSPRRLLHGVGDGVGDEHDSGGIERGRRDAHEGLHEGFRIGANVEGRSNLLAVLTATGVAGICGGDDGKHSTHTMLVHLGQDVIKERRAVAVPQQDRDPDSMLVKLILQGIDEGVRRRVDGAHPTEPVIVVSDLGQSLIRNATVGNPPQEGHNLLGGPRPTERCDEHRVVRSQRILGGCIRVDGHEFFSSPRGAASAARSSTRRPVTGQAMQSAFVKVDMSMTGAAISTSIPNTSDNELSQRSPRPFSEAILARAEGMCAMDAASRRKEAATSSTGTDPS